MIAFESIRPAGRLAAATALALTLVVAVAPAAGADDLHLPPGAHDAAQAIDRASLEAPIRILADDLLGGRGPASRGDHLSQLYLATELQYLGFQPAFAGGTYVQPFDLVGIDSQLPPTWSFAKGGRSVALKSLDDWIATSDVQEPTATLDDAELVFVGYGIQAPEYRWDDFKGKDLKGKVLVILNNDPDWDPQLFAGKTRLYYGRWTYKYESAGRQGAAGAIIIHTTPSAGYPWQVVQTSWSGEQFQLPAEGEPRIQVAAWVTEEAARRLMELAGQDLGHLVEAAHRRDFEPVPLGVTTSLHLANKIERVKTANIGGVLPGSDPTLADQVVVYSAHHDHLGIGKPDKNGDKIYNGALDNASGCAQLLAIAGAYKALPTPPRRSILFLFVAAEEQGLLGSKYYSLHPSVAPGKIAADINFDGGNIWGRTRDLTYVGFGKSSLDAVVTALAGQQGRKVLPDQFPDRGFFYRSDQFNFAKIGVPAIYLDTGTDFVGRPAGWGKEQIEGWEATHYHQPSDELTPDWNFDGMIQDARLGFLAGLSIAENPTLPSWRPGDEFEAARKAALAAVGGR